MESDPLLNQALTALLPVKWLEYFIVTAIKLEHSYWQIDLGEKEDRVPLGLGAELVQNF